MLSSFTSLEFPERFLVKCLRKSKSNFSSVPPALAFYVGCCVLEYIPLKDISLFRKICIFVCTVLLKGVLQDSSINYLTLLRLTFCNLLRSFHFICVWFVAGFFLFLFVSIDGVWGRVYFVESLQSSTMEGVSGSNEYFLRKITCFYRIESQNHLGWKRSPRSSSQLLTDRNCVNQTTAQGATSNSLNTSRDVYTTSPGNPFLCLTIQPKPSLTQLVAMLFHPVTDCLGEEATAPTWLQPPFKQRVIRAPRVIFSRGYKHPQLSQPLLIGFICLPYSKNIPLKFKALFYFSIWTQL